jgi:nicotinamide-nucleotide amidase
MRAAILTIGDELTCGYRLDTNSQVLSRRLALLPADVILHLSVGDDLEAIHRGLDVALEAADVVVITGGLGPTEDDLTRQTVAAHFGLGLVEDAEALARIRERFARFRRTMPESNRIQAQVPAGSTVIYNERGTAAGFYLPTGGKHIFVTPGIPYEMEGMLEGFILPRLRALVEDGRHVQRAALKVYGLPESEINERIRPMLARDRNPLLGLLPHRGSAPGGGRPPGRARVDHRHGGTRHRRAGRRPTDRAGGFLPLVPWQQCTRCEPDARWGCARAGSGCPPGHNRRYWRGGRAGDRPGR